MKPKGKEYENYEPIEKVWENINGKHFIIQKEVSDYIREIENKLNILSDIVLKNHIEDNVR